MLKNSLTAENVFQQLKRTERKNISYFINKTLPQMNQRKIRVLGSLLTNYEQDEDDHLNDRVLNIMTDVIDNKLGTRIDQNNKVKKRKINASTGQYQSPAVGYINLQSIMKDKKVKDAMRTYD